jgi:3-mercaptopyruvate sulfurtransferase SseA
VSYRYRIGYSPPWYYWSSLVRDVSHFLLQMGVSNSTHVVVYDNNAKFGFYSAGRCWWIFKVRTHVLVVVMQDLMMSG